jgi:hypothetical protein
MGVHFLYMKPSPQDVVEKLTEAVHAALAASTQISRDIAALTATVEAGFAALTEDIEAVHGEMRDMHADLRDEIVSKTNGLHKVLDYRADENRIIEARLDRIEKHTGIERMTTA